MAADYGLQPVMTLKTINPIAVRDHRRRAGGLWRQLGVGSRYPARGDAIGYGDGYPRMAPNGRQCWSMVVSCPQVRASPWT